ncbi:MAG: hypothetical protein IKS23_00930 [Alphaproteobacteria bacterium]|nr:hypothetical protein [Alphaproteobacteria bacterium]
MVEILGVLAIVGVLSIGALAGFSQAMLKHRFNRQTEQLHTLFRATIEHLNDLRFVESGTGGQYPLVYTLNALGEIPKDMIQGNITERTCCVYDPFKTKIWIYYHDTNYLGFIFYLNQSDNSVQVCRNIILSAQNFEQDISYVRFRNDASDGSVAWSGGEYNFSGGRNNSKQLKNATIAQMDAACRFCAEDRCLMYVMIK